MMTEMNNPPRFLTIDVLSDILKDFQWPTTYELEDDLPDGIVMQFPRCNLYFREGFAGDVEILFLTEDTDTDANISLGEALLVIAPRAERGPGPLTPGLIDDTSIYGSLEKVQNGIRDLCTIVMYHLKPCILGDFSWVAQYKAMMDAKSNA